MALRAKPTGAGQSPMVHEGHGYPVLSVAFSPDGKSVASGSSDNNICIWNASSPAPIGEPLRGHAWPVYSVAYSPLGDVLASGSADRTVRLWDVNTSRQMGRLEADNSVNSVAFSPDGNLLASGSRTVQVWDVQKRTPTSQSFKAHTGWINSVAFSPDGTRLVSGSSDNTIHVCDVERGVTVVGLIKGHTHSVSSVSFSPDGSQIISCSIDRTVRLWDSRSGEPIGTPYRGHADAVHSVAFSPHGTYVASGAYDNTVRLWDVRTGRQVEQPFKEHASWVRSVMFSPCGQYIASGADDGKVIIRSILDKVPDFANNLDSYGAMKEDGGSVQPEPIVSRHMSTEQIFSSLISTGCTDLSSQMDTRQDTAMIVSGGGFGDIWKGQLYSGTKVAIKAWRASAIDGCSYKTIKHAARELYHWSGMDHPNIHQLMGIVLFKDEYLGMVSEWMDNGNLHEYLRKHPDADRYRLCIHIASGVAYMHSRSMVHGDIKAANVLVTSDGVARVSDFDLSIMSEVVNPAFSESSNPRAGTLRWTAPELLLGEVSKATAQSDVYALGMTMLEVLTGDVPYPELRQDFMVYKAVDSGTLPIRPMNTLPDNDKSNLMWQLLLTCWGRNSSNRPLAGHVLNSLVTHICNS